MKINREKLQFKIIEWLISSIVNFFTLISTWQHENLSRVTGSLIFNLADICMILFSFISKSISFQDLYMLLVCRTGGLVYWVRHRARLLQKSWQSATSCRCDCTCACYAKGLASCSYIQLSLAKCAYDCGEYYALLTDSSQRLSNSGWYRLCWFPLSLHRLPFRRGFGKLYRSWTQGRARRRFQSTGRELRQTSEWTQALIAHCPQNLRTR